MALTIMPEVEAGLKEGLLEHWTSKHPLDIAMESH